MDIYVLMKKLNKEAKGGSRRWKIEWKTVEKGGEVD
jgi:hypothetical protein